ncbi:hypothetical protein F5X98DRAFT_376800 [Xylaria grammica]|nr:hypothetical protein F5X98DRAFT_376800 [Xylaria grammica]
MSKGDTAAGHRPLSSSSLKSNCTTKLDIIRGVLTYGGVPTIFIVSTQYLYRDSD